MLKSNLLPPGRIRIYWDGAALLAHAETLGDPSLNWLDLPALAQGVGVRADHVWVAPAGAPDRSRRQGLAAYGAALRDLGVDCRAAPADAMASECLRCGHGWEDQRPASELALALAVLSDAMEDLWDAAFVFAAGRALSAIAEPLGRLFPAKRLGRVAFGPAPRLRFGPPTLAFRRADLAAARLPAPRSVARRANPHAAQEVSPCP